MKKFLILGVLICALFLVKTPTYGLSCAYPNPTFQDMYDEAPIVFRGIVTDVNFVYDDEDFEYCNDMGADTSKLGAHTFTFSVQEQLKGNVSSSTSLTHTVDSGYCSRGGSCIGLEEGEEYVVVTYDGETITSALCRPCPYMLASEFYNQPEQPQNECICTMEYSPVCGVDGKTYGNRCAMDCAGIDRAYDGECVDTPQQEQRVDSTCTRWFDGCNTCGVENGVVGACTEMACFTLEREKCLAHDFVYLTANHELLIQYALERHMQKFSQQQQTAEIDRLVARVEKKKNEILSILMVSLFPVGSPELRTYSLQLEALAHLDSQL